ncbi:MAG TPA: glycosyltransferase [Blastocatellia bacterium]|nr:glycosyltransferase [Blastocatellia bacterium]
MAKEVEITVVISTYNRSEMLAAAIESVVAQENEAVSYEVIVVDNNSTDKTREVVEGYIKRGQEKLRYVFEGRQGVSYARNTGIAEARGEIIAFADDDVRVSKDWVAKIKRAFDLHPEVDCIGGKVLPRWESETPRWLTRDHWMPLALQDYGDDPVAINADNKLCLVSANLAFRSEAFEETGLFEPDLQRVKNSIGSMEDAELLERFWRTGRKSLYVPDLIVVTDVPAERMTKSYHRRWHTGHGYFFAIMRSEEMERSSSRLFDVPAHLYKQAIADAAAWFRCILSGNRERAFTHEIGIRFFWGFFLKRRQDFLSAAQHGSLHEIFAFARLLISKGMSKEIG